MKVKVKKLVSDAVIPQYSRAGDAGLDLTCVSLGYDLATDTLVCKSGLSIEIPEGYVGLLFPRSSIYKTNLTQSNCVGVIDSGYRGELMVRFRSIAGRLDSYTVGDRFAQLIIIPYPQIELVESLDLSDTERGVDGYGSTGA